MATRTQLTRNSSPVRKKRRGLWKTEGSARRFRLHRAPMLLTVTISAGSMVATYFETLKGDYSGVISFVGAPVYLASIPFTISLYILAALREHDAEKVAEELQTSSQLEAPAL